MHKLTIHNFGPIRDAEVDVARFLILIGPQSSGKSTLAKLIYYFLHVRDLVMEYAGECAQSDQEKNHERNLSKILRNRFVNFFGPVRPPADVSITYEYGPGYSLHIGLDKEQHRYVTPTFSDEAKSRIMRLLAAVQGRLHASQQPLVLSTFDKLALDQQRAIILRMIRDECNSIFSYNKELHFIPAGRSLLSTLSDQMENVHPHSLDFPMRQFVETVNRSRVFFGKPLSELTLERMALSTKRVDIRTVKKAEHYVTDILKGQYRYDRDGGKLYVSKNVYTKINYASSGQQEAVWILLSLFLLTLEQRESLVVVEEPEAHLFPDAQKALVEYIAFVYNQVDCDFVITTHSPYVLSCVNNLLYAYELASRGKGDRVAQVFPRSLWLDPSEIGGYFVSDGTVKPLMDENHTSIKAELVDSASTLINAEFDKLLEIEAEE